jgi:undecaprenyl diphosphate synthase
MKKIPKHVAIIMDGNGRWAENRGQPRFTGHLAGTKNAPRIIDAAIQAGVEVLSLFAFSTENWKRPQKEVNYLMGVFLDSVKNQMDQLQTRQVRLRVIGERSKLPDELQRYIEEAENLTKHYSKLTLVFALNYSGRWDLLQATGAISKAIKKGELQVNELNEAKLSQYLVTAGIPDPDLLIRTSGELRISNFFLWQLAYTELYFTDLYWPDFQEEEFMKALETYSKKERRFGGILHKEELNQC